jgi:hypothetical protein
MKPRCSDATCHPVLQHCDKPVANLQEAARAIEHSCVMKQLRISAHAVLLLALLATAGLFEYLYPNEVQTYLRQRSECQRRLPGLPATASGDSQDVSACRSLDAELARLKDKYGDREGILSALSR